MELGKHTFRIGRPQRIAAVFLLIFLAQCLWVVHRQQLTETDYRFARCGREMWERPSPLAGYFTTCGNMQDGTFAYRAAGLPLTLERLALSATDLFRKPENRLYAQATAGSTWESRHQLVAVKYLLHLPFIGFALWLAGGLWWVSRRLFGNEGGAVALALYTFCPAVIRYACTPNNEILAIWGLYGAIYAAIGVAHALQGPRRKWRPRIILISLAIGLTACAHLSAAIVGMVWAAGFLLYLAERRRSQTIPILIFAAIGSLALLFISYSLRPEPFSYIFTGGGALMGFSLAGARQFFTNPATAPITIATLIALILFLGVKRSRYFGNAAPLAVALSLFPLITTQVISQPWFWALPFLFTFIAGIFADALETKHRKLFLGLTLAIMATQALFCVAALSTLTTIT
ncbi:MAG: hypothetical protein P4L10_07600 [Acidobacteriaceae bacterium]|nr:hypothetical protein [Acidobacteriaceae bacterium]